MPRKPKKQTAQPESAKSYDEFSDDGEGVEEDVPGTDVNDAAPNQKLRDWRDVERLKEERMLRKLIGDDLDFDDLDSPRPGSRRPR